jgi:hypothetical protein
MIRFWEGKVGLRAGLTRMVQSPRTARAACLVAGLLLVAQTARAVFIYTRENDLIAPARPNRALLRDGNGASGANGPGGASTTAADSSSPILRHFPADDRPGLLLSDLMAILDAAGIETYRYRLLLGASSGGVAEVDPNALTPAYADRPIEALLPQTETGTEQVDDLVPLELTGVEIPPPPPGIKKWELALHVRTSYARLIQALRLLEADERIWDVPRVCVYRANDGIEADLRLATYGQAGTGGAGAGQIPSLPAQLTVPAPARWPSYADDTDPAAALAHDPFRERRLGTFHSRPVLPRLGAIRLGAGEAAWLDGQAVRPGEFVGEWTLVEIHSNEVLVRHARGWKQCIRLHEPPGREAPDVQP